MSIPTTEVQVPDAVLEIASGRKLAAVWQNELGGFTFRLGDGPDREFIKWCPHHPEFDLELEAAKLSWAGRYIIVPPVIGVGADDQASWLHTRGVEGETAVSSQWADQPKIAVRAIGTGLRALHDRLPLDDCPYSWSVADRFALIDKESERQRLADAPDIDQLVVCHGDACSPNTLITPDGQWSAHVDLGRLGVADRWADLAVATMALDWNYYGSWEAELLDAYGIDPDPERTDYYRRLWNAA